jgi:hypothetical protein
MGWGPQTAFLRSARTSSRFKRGALRRLVRKFLAGAASILTPQGYSGALVPILVPVRQPTRRRR